MSVSNHLKSIFANALHYIDDSVDAILNINQLHKLSAKRLSKDGDFTLLNMLHKAVMLKSPTVSKAFNHYLLQHTCLILDKSSNNLIYYCSNSGYKHSLSFLGWLRSDKKAHIQFNDIDYTALEKALFSYTIATRMQVKSTNSLPKQIIMYRSDFCTCCGKKFKIGSSDFINNHTCNTANTAKSIRTISGGAGPGTGKRR